MIILVKFNFFILIRIDFNINFENLAKYKFTCLIKTWFFDYNLRSFLLYEIFKWLQ